MYGPGSIAVQCARKTFKFYSTGIYDDPKCSKFILLSVSTHINGYCYYYFFKDIDGLNLTKYLKFCLREIV